MAQLVSQPRVSLRDRDKENRCYKPSVTPFKISELKAWLLSQPNFFDSYGDLALVRLEFRFNGATLSDAALVPRLPDSPAVDLEFAVPEVRRFNLAFEHSQKSVIFEAALTVGVALRKLAAVLRIPLCELSLLGEGGAALGAEESLRSAPERLGVHTGGWFDIPVQIGDARKSFFLPRRATAADLRSALWFDRGPSAALCELTFYVWDQPLALTDALSAARISATRFVSVREGRRLSSATTSLTLRFPNGELLQLTIPVEVPLSLLRYGIAAERCLSFTEISFEHGGVSLPEDAMQRTVPDLGLGLQFELAVVGPRINFQFDGLLKPGAPFFEVSALDRFFDLRRRVSVEFARSPFDFDFALDGETLDDEMVLAQAGFGAQAVIRVASRPPLARLYLSDLDNRFLIVDVNEPTKTRWGDLARQFSAEQPQTIVFEFHGRPLERFHAVVDPRNADAEFSQPFLSPPRDPITIYIQAQEIRILPESGDEELRAIPVTAQTSCAHLTTRLKCHYRGQTDFTFVFDGKSLPPRTIVLEVNPDLIEPFFLRIKPPQTARRALGPRDWSYFFRYNESLRSLAITELATGKTAQLRWAKELEVDSSEIEIRSGSQVLRESDTLKPWETYEVKCIVQRRAGFGAMTSSMQVSGSGSKGGRSGVPQKPQRPPDSSLPESIEFTDGRQKWSYPRTKVPTAGRAKARLSRDTGAPADGISIYAGRRTLSEGDPLNQKSYTVAISVPLRCCLTLRSQPPIDHGCILKREITVDAGVETVGDLIGRYCPRSEFPSPVTVLSNETTLDLATPIAAIPPGGRIALQYPAPPRDSVHVFRLPDGTRESQSIPFDHTVADVKSVLLAKYGLSNALPTVLRFTFWDQDLDDSEVFTAFGLPASAEVSVSRKEAKSISVRLPDGRASQFLALESDRISALKQLIARATGRPAGDLVLRSRAGDIDPGLLISDLGDGVELEAVLPFAPFVFESSAGPRTVLLLPTATIGEARTAIAAELGCPPKTVLLLRADKAPIADSEPIAAHPSPWLSCLQELQFTFDSQLIVIPVDFDAPIKRVIESVCGFVSVPSAEYVLFKDNAELDHDNSLNDFGISPSDVIGITRRPEFGRRGSDASSKPSPPAPEPRSPTPPESSPPAPEPLPSPQAPVSSLRELRVILLIGFVPRNATFKIDATKTLADLLPHVVARFGVQDLAVEFVSGDLYEENWSFLPLTTPIAEVPDKSALEVLCLREASAITPDAPGADPMAGLYSTLATTVAPSAPAAQDGVEAEPEPGIPYRFDIPDRGVRTFRFDATAKVANARKRIAQEYSLPSEDAVTLIFIGKALKDTFLLNRLRIGDGVITVCIRDDQAVLLLTAKANRPLR
jgi:hypothetical protein